MSSHKFICLFSSFSIIHVWAGMILMLWALTMLETCEGYVCFRCETHSTKRFFFIFMEPCLFKGSSTTSNWEAEFVEYSLKVTRAICFLFYLIRVILIIIIVAGRVNINHELLIWLILTMNCFLFNETTIYKFMELPWVPIWPHHTQCIHGEAGTWVPANPGS